MVVEIEIQPKKVNLCEESGPSFSPAQTLTICKENMWKKTEWTCKQRPAELYHLMGRTYLGIGLAVEIHIEKIDFEA
ncbi:hypothetical protein HanHA300_Chr03g0074171 [Helianthus annuus]|nr:hypothetical protein HanHA300_Chr03g0074171 [Helianthus annuus]KAJ0772400.1 hypothetical protein HanOQP8_Chr03g0086891 [Helianthus annuus]